MLADCDAAVVLVDPTAATETTEWAAPLRRADGGPVVVTVVDGATDGPARRDRPGPQDVAFLQYTSGSTSSPKGVVVTHANVLHHHDAFTTTLDLVPDDVFCSWLPGYHDFGLVGMLLVPLGLGATAVVVPSTSFLKRPVRWLSAITETGRPSRRRRTSVTTSARGACATTSSPSSTCPACAGRSGVPSRSTPPSSTRSRAGSRPWASAGPRTAPGTASRRRR